MSEEDVTYGREYDPGTSEHRSGRPSPPRSLDDILATGAAWITEAELERLVAHAHFLRKLLGECHERVNAAKVEISRLRAMYEPDRDGNFS